MLSLVLIGKKIRQIAIISMKNRKINTNKTTMKHNFYGNCGQIAIVSMKDVSTQ